MERISLRLTVALTALLLLFPAPAAHAFWRAPAPPANTTPLRSAQKWTDLRFTVAEDAIGVFLEVAGRIEFDRAALVFEDGSSQAIDLAHTIRGSGLYELTLFGGVRRIKEVRVHARADSPLAHVGVRLGR